MAEGDTVLRTARRLEQTLAGRALGVSAPNPRGRATGVERLDGRELESVEARGKNLLLSFGDLVLHSHLGMSGSWRVFPLGGRWGRPRGAAWAVLASEDAEAVQFGGPTLRVVAASALRSDPVLSRLGPDVLAPGFEPGAAIRLLRADPGRELGDALLDQRTVAGIGNIWKSEACFKARLDPRRPIGELSDEEIGRALIAARGSMQASAAGRRPPYSVYRRAGRPCPACGTPIAASRQGDANRATYWCPRCQPAAVSASPRTGKPE
jgi:endonuclease-8